MNNEINIEKRCAAAGMDVKEYYNISTAALVNKLEENLDKNIKSWYILKAAGQINRELGNVEKATGISSETIKNFGAIIFAPYAQDIFGIPKVRMSDEELGIVSNSILLAFVKRKGLQILPQNQERRHLGNIAKATGIELERLMLFSNIFMKIVIDMFYLPNRSI